MGKTTLQAPPPSQSETDLRQEQTSLLRQQRDLLTQQFQQQNLLAPVLMQQAGLQPTRDAQGNITGYQQIPNPLMQMGQDIQKQFMQRTQAALEGKLPVDPALLRDLGLQEQDLRESLRKNMGPGYEMSTPGQMALQRFMESKNIALEGARRGDLSLAQQLGVSQQQANQSALENFFNTATFAQGYPFQGIGALGSLSTLYQNPLNNLAADRRQQFLANQSNVGYQRQLQQQLYQGIGQLGGQAVGFGLGGGFGGGGGGGGIGGFPFQSPANIFPGPGGYT